MRPPSTQPAHYRTRAAGVFFDMGMVYTPAYEWDFSNYANDFGVAAINAPHCCGLTTAFPFTILPDRPAVGRFQFSAGYQCAFPNVRPFMKMTLKRKLVLLLGGASLLPVGAAELKIGLIDSLKKVFDDYYKTKLADASINEAAGLAGTRKLSPRITKGD